MIREEILAMKPGRELDAEIALRVFGVKEITVVGKHYFIDPLDKVLPSYSTDISAAWEVVEKFERVRIYRQKPLTKNKWEVGFVANDFEQQFEVTADTAPEAICKAALLAVIA